jgi:hypothetical protein
LKGRQVSRHKSLSDELKGGCFIENGEFLIFNGSFLTSIRYFLYQEEESKIIPNNRPKLNQRGANHCVSEWFVKNPSWRRWRPSSRCLFLWVNGIESSIIIPRKERLNKNLERICLN